MLSPEQNVVAPEALIDGTPGKLFSVTTIEVLAEVQPFPSIVCSVYVPGDETVIEGVVAVVDQTLPVEIDEFSTKLPPAQ